MIRRLLAVATIAMAPVMADAQAADVVTLTQTGCQFVESENGVDHGYHPQTADDCKEINEKTGSDRLAAAKTMELAAGKHTFRVSNKNVPYELGFWLRDADYNPKNPLHKATKFSVIGGGLTEGKSRDFDVELEPGEYVYSCPLNPTLIHTLVVK